MSECPGTEYQNIDLDKIFDLRDSQLVRAQINTISGGTNTADITLLDPCPALDGVDLTAVEFFYHCEWSKGTLRDLQYGFKAFEELDFVYCLFTPPITADPDDVATFYIVGHIDIQATEMCSRELRAVGSEAPEQLDIFVPGVGVISPVYSGGWNGDYTLWERRMVRCATTTPFIDTFPNTILNVRYQNKEDLEYPNAVTGYTALTVVDGVHKYGAGNYTMAWDVIVERIAGDFPVNEVLRLRFFYADFDGKVHVSAAMSRDLRSVYVISNRPVLGEETTFYKYTFDTATGLWPLVEQGTVPLPSNPYQGWGHLPYLVVDRDGNIGGGWEPSLVEQVLVSSNPPYSTYRTVVAPGQTGGTWNMISKTWDATKADEAWIGYSANSSCNDIVVVKGSQTSSHTDTDVMVNDGLGGEEPYHTFGDAGAGTNLFGEWGFGSSFDVPYAFDVSIGGTQFDEMRFTSEILVEVETIDVRAIRVTKGGIIFAYDKYSKPGDPSVDEAHMISPFDMDVVVTPSWMPVSCDQTYTRSFTAIDEESEQAICGMFATSTGSATEKTWRIFRNGEEVTEWVKQCLALDPEGKPIEQLMGMYWRA